MTEVVVTKVVEEVAGSLLTKVKKEIGYMWNCKENVEKLRSEVGKLKDMKERVEQKIKLALDNGDELVAGVEKWVEDALAHITKAKEFLQEEAHAKKTFFNLQMCVNLNTLHHYGKEATNKVPFLEQHQKDGATFDKDEIFIPAPVPGILDIYGTHDTPNLQWVNRIKVNGSTVDEILAKYKEPFVLVSLAGSWVREEVRRKKDKK